MNATPDAADGFTADLFSVRGRVALVTGGSSGIGAMIARGLHVAGAIVTIVSRDPRPADWPAGHVRGDLASVPGVDAIAAEFARMHDKLDILINAAGMHWAEPIDRFSHDGWNGVLDLNLKQPFFLAQSLLGPLRTAATPDHPARIVNIASSSGLHVPGIENYSYAASKAALIHLSRHMAHRLAGENINVNAIAPGPVPSRMFAETPAEHIELLARKIPRGRFGRDEDFAGAILYLCSRAGAYVTGATLSVDGGMVALL